MSARDAESGSSTYKGGSGRSGGLGNGGVGGGMGGGGNYGGGMGGGAGRGGGIGSRTGLTGGNTMYGNTAYGQAGGNVQAYGMRDAASLNRAGMGPTAGTYGNFKTPSGQAMFGGSPVQGQSFTGMNMGQALSQAQRAQAAYEASQRPQGVPGLLGGAPTAVAAPAPAPEYVPQLPNMYYPPYTTPATVPGVPAPPATPAVPEVYTPWNPFAQTTPGTTPNGIRPAGEYGARRTGPNSSEFNKNFNSSRGYGGGNTVYQNGN